MTENTSEKSQSQSIDSFYESMQRHYPYTDKIIEGLLAEIPVEGLSPAEKKQMDAAMR